MDTQDVIIVGGSYAGLSAAMSLGRSLRRTLVIDGGDPCNKRAPASHNFLAHDGDRPLDVLRTARRQVERYGSVQLLAGQVTDANGRDGNFTVRTAAGETYRAKRLLFATGLRDGLPDIPGLTDCWSISAIHCPYCHGYEVRHQPTGLLMNNEHVPFMVNLVGNLTDKLTVFTNGPATFDVKTIKVTVYEEPIERLTHHDGYVEEVCLAGGERVRLEALYLHPQLSQKCPLPEHLGCELDDNGFLKVDAHGLTTVPGVYAAGDCTTMMRSVAYATGSGNVTGAMLNNGLVLAGLG